MAADFDIFVLVQEISISFPCIKLHPSICDPIEIVGVVDTGGLVEQTPSFMSFAHATVIVHLFEYVFGTGIIIVHTIHGDAPQVDIGGWPQTGIYCSVQFVAPVFVFQVAVKNVSVHHIQLLTLLTVLQVFLQSA